MIRRDLSHVVQKWAVAFLAVFALDYLIFGGIKCVFGHFCTREFLPAFNFLPVPNSQTARSQEL